MPKYKIDWLENDKYGNKKVSVSREDGTKLLAAELGKEYKDIEVMAGHEINANEWTSPKNGKVYLFKEQDTVPGEKPRGGAPGAFKGAQIEKAQDRKNEMIGKTLDRKEESIRLSSAQRDAVLIVKELIEANWSPLDIKQAIIEWRNWFLLDREFNNPPPFE